MTTGSGRTLSRDYKHVRRHTPGGAGQSFNGWMGLAVGLAIGLSVALGVFVHDRRQPPAQPEPAASAAPASASAPDDPPQDTAAETEKDPAKDLTFYTDLPKQQVEVPRQSLVKPGARPSRLPKGDVTLQAGAFKQSAEAEKLQAKLVAYGIDSKIQRFSVDDETWFRVRIGPIATVEQLEEIRSKLAEADIDATPVTPENEPPP